MNQRYSCKKTAGMIFNLNDDILVVGSGMPPNAQGPVQVRKPLTVPDTVNGHSVGRNGFHSNACRQAGGRRIFVQAYSGERKYC